MQQSLRPMLSAVVFFLSAAVAAAAPATPAPAMMSLAGTITSVNAGTLVLDMGGNKSTVAVTPDTLVLSRQAATYADIKPGEAMGVAAKKEADGSLTATSINIFSPELWKVAQKGQWPMTTGEIMTNAVVTDAMVSAMNAGTISLVYQDVSAKIAVPATADIHRLVTVPESDLKPGMRVSVRATTSNGTLAASSVSFDVAG